MRYGMRRDGGFGRYGTGRRSCADRVVMSVVPPWWDFGLCDPTGTCGIVSGNGSTGIGAVMETFTLNLNAGSWLRRLVPHSTLVRTTDRIEAAAVLLVLLVALLAVPVVCAVGTTRYDSQAHAYAAQRLTSHEIDATMTQDSTPSRMPYQKTFLTPVQWQFAGRQHTATIATQAKMNHGDQ